MIHIYRVLAAATALASMPALAAEQIVVVERPVGETTMDLGAKGDSVGDLLVFANKVYDAGNKMQLGTDNGYCVRTVVGKSWECFWTLTLKGGQITVEGPFMDSGDSLLAVTGGTGKYAGARGSMKLHPRDPTPTAYDFTYDLL
jgi:allene oxide cyclase